MRIQQSNDSLPLSSLFGDPITIVCPDELKSIDDADLSPGFFPSISWPSWFQETPSHSYILTWPELKPLSELFSELVNKLFISWSFWLSPKSLSDLGTGNSSKFGGNFKGFFFSTKN